MKDEKERGSGDLFILPPSAFILPWLALHRGQEVGV